MNSGDVVNIISVVLSGDTVSLILKLILGVGLGIVWWLWSKKIKQAAIDQANAATKKTQGDQLAGTAKDTKDFADDGNAAADKIDQIHKRSK